MGQLKFSSASCLNSLDSRRILNLRIAFLMDQWARLPDTAKDLTGKTVIVVGANVGLGFEGLFLNISLRV
jgi:hypothetical protein